MSGFLATIDHFILRVRAGLSYLAQQPWFPQRKVIGGALAALAAQGISHLTGLDVPAGVQSIIDGSAALLVAWAIPERAPLTAPSALAAASQTPFADITAAAPPPEG